MLNYIRNLFNKNKKQTTTKAIQQQLLELQLGSYVMLELKPEICLQHIAKNIDRFDSNVLTNKQLKGLVKAVYVSEQVNHVYVEVVGLIVGHNNASRKEYVVMHGEIERINVISV